MPQPIEIPRAEELTELARILCRATKEILALRHADALAADNKDLIVRIKTGAWATYHMPPQKSRARGAGPEHHIIQFGTRCVESFFDKERLTKNAQDDLEVRTYGVMPKYGPLTPAVALSFLVLHEFAHMLVFLDGHSHEGHGRRFQDKLKHLHDQNDGVLIAAFLRTEAERRNINLDSFIVHIPPEIPFKRGERVFWFEKKVRCFGTVLRVNKQSLTIRPDGADWKAYVPPSSVQKVHESPPDQPLWKAN